MATIDDVARAAGVSVSTVSYALSGKRPISESTRRRIETAISSLGYRPRASARALATSRTDTIGLMAPLRTGVDLNVIMLFVSGITRAAHEHDLDVLLVTHGENPDLSRVTDASRVDGLVVMDIEADDPRLDELRRLSEPVVLIGVPRDTTGLICIDLDFVSAGSLAARRLADLGHRKVALLGAPSIVRERHTSYAERIETGFAREADSRGILHSEWSVDASIPGARAVVDELLSDPDPATGLVIHNEAALPHILAGLTAAGRRIPDDLSVIAVCPDNVAMQSVPVSSIDIPAERIGRMAVDMIVERLHEREPSSVSELRLVGPTLTERGSTAPAPS